MRIFVLSTVAAMLLVACPQQETQKPARTPTGSTSTNKPEAIVGEPTPGQKATPAPPPMPGPAGRQQVVRYRLRRQNLTDQQLAAWIAERPAAKELISLDLRENRLTHVGVEALARAQIGTATSLLLSENPIGDRGATAIATARKRFFSVNILYLANTKITAAGVRALLDEQSGLKWIWEIDLSNNPIGDAGVEVIAKSANTQTMRSMTLSNVGMTDKGARALAASSHLGRLEDLYVDGNKLTPAGVKALKASTGLAKCTVYVGEEK